MLAALHLQKTAYSGSTSSSVDWVSDEHFSGRMDRAGEVLTVGCSVFLGELTELRSEARVISA
jgi:hypothetical protein